jgi:hypothetical protein
MRLPADPGLIDRRLTDPRLTDPRLTDPRLTDPTETPSPRVQSAAGKAFLWVISRVAWWTNPHQGSTPGLNREGERRRNRRHRTLEGRREKENRGTTSDRNGIRGPRRSPFWLRRSFPGFTAPGLRGLVYGATYLGQKKPPISTMTWAAANEIQMRTRIFERRKSRRRSLSRTCTNSTSAGSGLDTGRATILGNAG